MTNRPGDLLAARYRLVDLLSESGGGKFWRAHDRVLERTVAVHAIAEDDVRAAGLLQAARRSATLVDGRLLRVLDAEISEGQCYVVNEWGSGTSLDTMLANNGPLPPRRAAWVVAEVADSIAGAHGRDIAHGRLVPENVMLDRAGAVRIIGCCVDAALHGLPPDRIAADIDDLAGLLHAALTGRWAGPTASSVPPVPRAHDRPLRPRQVRAGVPRPLDDLVDDVLGADGRHRVRQLAGAREIEQALVGYVGDPTGVGEALVAANPEPDETITLPPVPDPVLQSVPRVAAQTQPQPTPVLEPVLEPEPVPVLPSSPARDERATEAGLPIFDDEIDDVSWLRTRAEPAAPPPPLPEPVDRPLFAPEPAAGEPARRTRHPVPASGGRPKDPWAPGGVPGTHGVPPTPPTPVRLTGPGVGDGDAVGRVPGRRSLRLAFLVGLALLLLLGILVAVNLGRGRTLIGRDPTPSTPTSTGVRSTAPTTSAPPTPLTGLTVRDFDPQGQGDPPQENPELAAYAVDGDPTTAWRTETYRQQLGPGGLKTGVGLIVDLGRTTPVSAVDLTLVGAPTGASVYLTDTPPAEVTSLTPAATATAASTTARIAIGPAASGRYLTVWLTSLPAVSGGYRGEVAEIRVLS